MQYDALEMGPVFGSSSILKSKVRGTPDRSSMNISGNLFTISTVSITFFLQFFLKKCRIRGNKIYRLNCIMCI